LPEGDRIPTEEMWANGPMTILAGVSGERVGFKQTLFDL
jgi:hypothetical protein